MAWITEAEMMLVTRSRMKVRVIAVGIHILIHIATRIAMRDMILVELIVADLTEGYFNYKEMLRI
ncbi:hypothetical protein AR691_13425 [Bacillus amyloliquefaciens]|nr:hypothetical protein AR691_13425 [Bacillus amyloliquefaciens]